MNRPEPSLRDVQRVVERSRSTLRQTSLFGSYLSGISGSTSSLFSIPETDPYDRAGGFLGELRDWTADQLDGDRVDREEQIPEEYLEKLRELGGFGVKIDPEYGGLGYGQSVYNEFISILAAECSSTALTMSAHQSIGVSEPLRQHGTEEQKQRWLPEICSGSLSGFALTEETVGSDPARMRTTAESVGDRFRINGKKLWCTNGPEADLLVVLAKSGEAGITAFVVPGEANGVTVEHRCRFMGLRGIANGLLEFTDVEVPSDHVIGEPGDGLRIALSMLTVGRLTMPAMCRGAGRRCVSIARDWATSRVQWGKSIVHHEQVGRMLTDIASDQFILEAMTAWVSSTADRTEVDLRMEAALGKLLASEILWDIADNTLQIRGGRGYEMADSLRQRGETAYPVERILRDARLNRIGEGTSEILRMYIAREWLDPLVGELISEEIESGEFRPGTILGTGYRVAKTYLGTLGPSLNPFRSNHIRFLSTARDQLLRSLIHQTVRYRQDLQNRQLVLVRHVDAAGALFKYAVAVWYQAVLERNHPEISWAALGDYTLDRCKSEFYDNLRGNGGNVAPSESLIREVSDGRFRRILETPVHEDHS